MSAAETASRRTAILWLVASVAFVVKCVLAVKTYGTNDVYTYERFAVWGRYFGADLYSIAPDLNHPPSMLHVLSWIKTVADATGAPFRYCLRFVGIVADLGSLALVTRMLRDSLHENQTFAALLLMAAAPYELLIAGFHGNTDPLMICLVLAAVYLAGYRERPGAAGVAFGLAMCIKVAPLVAVPAIFLNISGVRKRSLFLGSVVGTMAILWYPYVYAKPTAVLTQVFGYKSSYGLWGVSWMLRELAFLWPALVPAELWLQKIGGPAVLLVTTVAAYLMSRMQERPPLYVQVGAVYFLFFALTGGFAVQYLAWLTPWLAAVGVVSAGLFVTTASFFLLVVYNYWALGFPWYLGIAYPWEPHQYFQVLCWLSVVAAAVSVVFRVRGYFTKVHVRVPGFVYPGLALATAALLVWPAVQHIRADSQPVTPVYGQDVVLYTQSDELNNLADELARRGRTTEASAVRRQAQQLESDSTRIYEAAVAAEPARRNLWTPEDLLDRSQKDYDSGLYDQCLIDSREALTRRRAMPPALSNLSLCSLYLGDWDTAIEAARMGLKIAPDWSDFRRNLDYALAQKAAARRK